MERKAASDRIVYADVFPETKIAFGGTSVDLWRLDGSKTDNYLSTAPSATVTGFGADFIIIDDIVKNAYEANNRDILEDRYKWFTDTMYSRLEGKRKLILIMTRWATKDLAGRVIDLYESQGRKYRVISKAAFDGSKMLNERVLSKDQYDLLIQTIGEDIVRANYDQEPIDIKGRLHSTFQTYQRENIPAFRRICAQCDTADKGEDFLCLIIYGETFNRNAYVLDVYYTKDGMNITENEIPRRLTETKAIYARFESNFGGEAFAKIIKIQIEKLGNYFTQIRTFTQTKNKEARILANSIMQGDGGNALESPEAVVGMEFLPAQCVFPLTVRYGKITEIAFASERTVRGKDFVYLEVHTLEASNYVIRNRYFQDRFDDSGTGVVTATQYTGEKQELKQNAAKHSIIIEKALQDIVCAILWAGKNLLGQPVDPETKIEVKFSDGYIVSDEERKADDRQDLLNGVLLPWEYRMRQYGEDEETAKAVLAAGREDVTFGNENFNSGEDGG